MRTFLTGTRFALLWILGTIFALAVTGLVAALLGVSAMLGGALLWGRSGGTPNPNTLLILTVLLTSILGGSFGLFLGSVQKSLMRQMTGDAWRGWLIASAAGGIFGVTATVFLIRSEAELLLTLRPLEIVQAVGLQLFAVPFLCMGLAQWPALMHNVRNAWLWVLANLAAGLAMYGLLAGGLFSGVVSVLIGLGLLALLAAAPGIVTGFTMLWLLVFQRKTDTWA